MKTPTPPLPPRPSATPAREKSLFAVHLIQDRLRNRPDAAAQRLIARLRASAPPGGVFNATRDLLLEWRKEGERLGDPFRLHVARALALANHHNKGLRRAASLDDLALCQLTLGERDADPKYLRTAAKNFTIVRDLCAKQKDWQNWAVSQHNLGITLLELGGRDGDTARLHQAVAAFQAALTVHTPKAAPMDWAGTQHNLAIAYLILHDLDQGEDWLDKAKAAFDSALTLRTRQAAEYLWADSHGGLGKVGFARFRLTGNRDYLAQARSYLTEARAVFALDPNNVTLQDFDRLLAKIDAAQVGGLPCRSPVNR